MSEERKRRNFRNQELLSEKEITDKFKDVNLEKNDTNAMIIAALITFLPVLILVLGGLYFILWLFFLR